MNCDRLSTVLGTGWAVVPGLSPPGGWLEGTLRHTGFEALCAIHHPPLQKKAASCSVGSIHSSCSAQALDPLSPASFPCARHCEIFASLFAKKSSLAIYIQGKVLTP